MFITSKAGIMKRKAPADPYVLNMSRNDLDFIYSLATLDNPSSTINRLDFIISFDTFFTNGGDHIPFGVNCIGDNAVHCGPIVRNGFPLFNLGRGGFIKSGTNQVYAENWNGTASPGVQLLTKIAGSDFDPSVNTQVKVRLDCTWTDTGSTAYDVNIKISSMADVLLFEGQVSGDGTVYDRAHSTESRAFIGGIATGFISPNDTGCVETTASGSAPNAKATITSLVHTII